MGKLALTFARVRAMAPRKLAWIAVLPLVALSWLAIGQSTPSAHPTIPLASEPLYARGTRDKPTLTLALSVEFPTVGALYTSPFSATNDFTYNPDTEYVGYFDTESCYVYNNAPTEVASTDVNYSNYKRFDRSGAANKRLCGGTGFSGNFMNWATSSAVDILRMGLTGGDRWIDTANLTILQRAILQRNEMYNDSYFPSKRLVSTHASGAVPASLRGTHTGDIFIANCLDRVHFGTSRTGNCTNPGNNANLGVAGGTAGTTALATERFFFTRVQVCNAVGNQLQDTRQFNGDNYCVKYPAGNYKPVGNLQKYSDAMRVAVFGYLNQSDNARYGGVLRAPMKYVGPTQFDSYGVQMPAKNPQVEWSDQTGVFVANPLGDASGISGVVNYINKFGRTGNPTGMYKTFDPVGELYYEALRYLQGLGPTIGTTEATSPTLHALNTSDSTILARKDGFPVYETWTDPHAGGSSSGDYTCLRNNLFTIADIGTHADKYIPGNTRANTNDEVRPASVANNEPDFVYWTRVVGAFEAGAAIEYKVGPESSSRTVKTYNPNPSTGNYQRYTDFYASASNHLGTLGTGAGSAAFYIAGMAYWARTHDIRGSDWTAQPSKQRPGMRVKTYVLDVNQNASSSATDTRRKSQLFLAAKYGGFADESGIGNPYLTKDPAGAGIAALSDTTDASASTKYLANNAVWDKSNINYFDPTQPGEAGSHFLASDGRAVLRTLNNIFATIARDGFSVAGGAISTQRLTSVGGFVYQALFDAADWTGDLVSQYVRLTNNVVSVSNGSLSDPHQWHAAGKLNARIAAKPDASWRNVVVGKSSPTASATATAFLWNEVDTDVQTALSKATPSASADLRGQDRLNYIRGVRTLEGTTVDGTAFRKRGGLLGDILNSGVAYSGAPTANQAGADYKKFFDDNKSRTKALFVGANDGMLHAFNAADGEELFAYIPSWVVKNLPALTSPSYNAGGHQSYVDGTPAVSEAEVGAPPNAWKTVLVSGTGAGGQGVFALDVTNPDSFDASKVMWEFTDRDDPDLGNVIGRPQILKFRTSAPGASTPTFKWFAVVPSGVNNNANDGYFSTTGKPALFLLDLSKGAAVAWQEGVNYYKVSLPAGSTTMPSGLVNFSATGGLAGEVQQIYLGDLQGNVWKLNFAGNGTAGWNLDTLSFFKTGGATPAALPFFVAKDDSGVVQPISAAPALTRGPNGGVIVLVGTGKYLETADNVVSSTTQKQAVYALLDTGSPVADSATPSSAISGRGRLKKGTVTSSTGAVSTDAFTWGRATSDTDATFRSGWYVEFPNRGERQVSGFGVLGTKLVFGSLIPPDQFTDPCGTGSGYQYFANLATGTGKRNISQVGLLGEPYVLELGEVDISVANGTGRRKRTTKGQIFLQGSEGIQVVVGDGAGGAFSNDTIIGRLSWRQIPNYAELRSEATP
ncbi:pilus assembly protein [Rhodoferax sp.]|jgi:type IV pilus assembly protein PilY1|uniref:pilus assembly protein n=1 Tax=Rhodoferax sp. TaxID=50421 RepID=UPI00378372D5